MSDNHDHPDTDLTDPHGEAEALRRENARRDRAAKRTEVIWCNFPDHLPMLLDQMPGARDG